MRFLFFGTNNTIHELLTDPTVTLFKNNIQNRFYIIFTYLKIILLQRFQFSISKFYATKLNLYTATIYSHFCCAL